MSDTAQKNEVVISSASDNVTLYDHAMATWHNTSARMRGLYALGGMSYCRVGKILDKRPQHVRNVILTPLTGKGA